MCAYVCACMHVCVSVSVCVCACVYVSVLKCKVQQIDKFLAMVVAKMFGYYQHNLYFQRRQVFLELR